MTKVKYNETLDKYCWDKDKRTVSGEVWEYLKHTQPSEMVNQLHPLYFAYCLDYIVEKQEGK